MEPILLITEETRAQRRLKRALAATGCPIYSATSLEEAHNILLKVSCPLLVVDYGSDAEWDASKKARYDDFFTRHAMHPGPSRKVLMLAAKRGTTELLGLFQLPFLSNLVAKTHPLALDELIITVGKIVRNDIFGLEKYLCYGVQPVAHPVTSSKDKGPLIAAMRTYSEELGIHRRLIAVAEGVADEFLMNAIYNAPRRSDGSHPYAETPRHQTVDLAPEEQSQFRFACDGRSLVLSVKDPFGSLTRETVLHYLRRCFQRGPDQIEDKDGGAGMGLYMVMESLNKFIINISPGKGTEMIGIIDISGSFRTYTEHDKSFHIFLE